MTDRQQMTADSVPLLDPSLAAALPNFCVFLEAMSHVAAGSSSRSLPSSSVSSHLASTGSRKIEVFDWSGWRVGHVRVGRCVGQSVSKLLKNGQHDSPSLPKFTSPNIMRTLFCGRAASPPSAGHEDSGIAAGEPVRDISSITTGWDRGISGQSDVSRRRASQAAQAGGLLFGNGENKFLRSERRVELVELKEELI